LISTNTKIEHSAKYHYFYNESESLSVVKDPSQRQEHVQFGTGNVTGHFVKEQIRIGTAPAKFIEHGAYHNLHDSAVNKGAPDQITVKDLHIGIIDSHSGIFNNFDFDAIIGMSYKYPVDGQKAE